MATASEIARCLQGKRTAGGYIACCPAHDDKAPSLSISEHGGKVLVKCHANCSQESVISVLRSMNLWPGGESAQGKNRGGMQAVLRVWDSALSSGHPEAALLNHYLESRGLNSVVFPLDSIRLAPALIYYENKENLGQFPAMLGQISGPTGEMIGVQRIYLNQSGKKLNPIEAFSNRKDKEKLSAKKILGSSKKGAVRLDPATGILCVAEGIETALAVRQATRLPCWAGVSAGGIENLEVPNTVKELRIWTDVEPSGVGKRAAQVLAVRYSARGVKCFIHDPSEMGAL